MGAEFVNITTAIDNSGHTVCKLAGLGKLTDEVFTDLFEQYLDNPSFICTDGNFVYEHYCKLKNIPHYVRDSNYHNIIRKAGYIPASGNKKQEEKNFKILEKLYYNEESDKILNRGVANFEEFNDLKYTNHLSLARVNELHSDIKDFINGDMRNVSTKYLSDYIGFFTYVRNWKVDNGHYPTSNSDAKDILIEILKNKSNYKIKEIQETKLNIPKPTTRYITLLVEHTEAMRAATKDKYFKFNEEDNIYAFNKREFFNSLSKRNIDEIIKTMKPKGYTKWKYYTKISYILKQPNVNEIIYEQIEKGHIADLDDEDIKALRAGKYRI